MGREHPGVGCNQPEYLYEFSLVAPGQMNRGAYHSGFHRLRYVRLECYKVFSANHLPSNSRALRSRSSNSAIILSPGDSFLGLAPVGNGLSFLTRTSHSSSSLLLIR